MSNLYRGPSIDASYQVSVHLVKQFQKRRFLEIDQSKTTIAYGGQVCQQIGTKWAIFTEDLPWILPTKFRFILLSISEEIFLEIDQPETRFAYGDHVC